MKRILCVLSHVLGNRTYSDLMVEGLRGAEGLKLEYLTLGAEDYRKYPASRLMRTSNTLEAAAVFRAKLRAEAIPEHDGLVFNGLPLAVEMLPSAGRKPALVATDTTPRLMREQQLRLKPGFARQTLLQASGIIQDYQVRAITGRVSVFLAMSNVSRDSLIAHYGANPERCHVTYAPKPLGKNRAKREPGLLRLLFVGNDFSRKGGNLLLEAYRRRLNATCTMTIISNDPVLGQMTLPEGVRWVRGLGSAAEVAPYYSNHDLFVYPSRLDQLPNVLAEAAAAGLPAIAGEVGGIRDLVKDGQTGLVLDWGADVETWIRAIERFAGDEAFWQRCADGAYQLAQQTLSIERFNGLIQTASQRMFERIGK